VDKCEFSEKLLIFDKFRHEGDFRIAWKCSTASNTPIPKYFGGRDSVSGPGAKAARATGGFRKALVLHWSRRIFFATEPEFDGPASAPGAEH
jgi:hypothetical protein